MSEYGDLLASIPVGESVYVKWHYAKGVTAPNEPQEFRGTIISHGKNETHIRNERGTNLYMYRGEALIDVDWLDADR